jgi:hypothetical protein
VMASSSHLKPGEKGSLTATVDTHNRMGLTVKTVEVFTNDPERPKVVLTLKADIKGKARPMSPQQKRIAPH